MACNKALVLMITLNILLFTLVSSTYAPPPNPSTPPPKPSSTPPPVSPTPPPKPSTPPPSSTYAPPPKPITPPPVSPTLPPKPSTSPPVSPNSCPIDTLKLNVCANLLTDLLKLFIGTPKQTPCCKLILGLVDLEAAVCLCTALKAQVLGTNINIPITLSLLINACGKKVPSGFQCAN